MEKKPFYKKWWVWAIAVFIVIGIILSPKGGEKEAEPNKENHTVAKPKSKSLETKIKDAATPNLGEISNIEINNDAGKDDGGKVVLVHVKQDNVTKKAVNFETTKALKKVFEIGNVNTITYFWEATLVDNKGNESVDTVAKVQMSKETASTINWDNFSYTKLDQVADQYNASSVLK